jgi:hypothetical protein
MWGQHVSHRLISVTIAAALRTPADDAPRRPRKDIQIAGPSSSDRANLDRLCRFALTFGANL